jgi:hypothetical protein
MNPTHFLRRSSDEVHRWNKWSPQWNNDWKDMSLRDWKKIGRRLEESNKRGEELVDVAPRWG